MSSQAPPTIPPRPVKQQAAAQGVSKLPDIPPRPLNKRVDRSISPSSYPRSPLNEPYALKKTTSRPQDALPRPPSVHHLPTPGEEGMEYANIQYKPEFPSSALAQDAGAQTRTIAEDLHLHAPKPSLPKASATAQVQGVTHTDTGRAPQDDLTLSRTRSRQSYSRPDSTVRPDSAASGERRRSVIPDEQGPAEIGLRVPINPLLGDVQAPTPQAMTPQVTGEAQGRHSRRKSGLEDFRPPDSYGLHGHGVISNTKFERDWYSKHPEQLEHEEGKGHGVYESTGSGRGTFALSSDELNKLVRGTASRGAGFGTRKDINSYPDEQIGYMASEEYQRSQQNTPMPDSLSRMHPHPSQPAIESPLRRTSFPADDAQPAEIRRNRTSSSDKASGDEDSHHIDAPIRRFNKVTGGQETTNEATDPRSYVSRTDDEGNEYTVPILAEDEVAKHAGGEYLHPAVSPKFERRTSQPYDDHAGSGALTPTSRPSSRPGSIYQLHSASHSLSRFMSHQDEREHMHTPLEDVAEYEPLFEEDDEKKKALSHAERFKRRPDALQRRFPSQDIWEDTPSSAMYVAEVSTPDLPLQGDPDQRDKPEPKSTSTFEPPEAESARKGEVTEEEKEKLIPKEERLAKSKFAPHLRDDMPTKSRPSMANRFPSQDIWEDTPDSNYLTTTVGSPQAEEESSPVEEKPPVPARPAKSRLGDGASSAQIEPSIAPSIPARPPKRTYAVPPADAKLTEPISLSKETSPTELKKTPSIPDRPKPQIPPRPARKPAEDELTKVTSAGSTESTETVRSKPQVPARPTGGNIASLKGNFMSDLNKKLGLGPPKEKEKEPEPEVEAKPLEDARKGRARGPQRRAPAKSPAAEPKSTAAAQFSMFAPKSLWQIGEDETLSTIPATSKEDTTTITTVDHTVDHANASESMPAAETHAFEHSDDATAPMAGGFPVDAADQSADLITMDDTGNLEGDLTRKTTASTMSGEQIDREESNSQTHMLPASQMTTASDSDAIKEQLEKVSTKGFEAKAEDEPIQAKLPQQEA